MAEDPPKPPDLDRNIAKSFASILSDPISHAAISCKPDTLYKGEPSVEFSIEETGRLSSPYKFSLIGRFSFGRPAMETIRKAFHGFSLKAYFSIGLLDDQHILIKLFYEEDFMRLWLRDHLYIFKAPMKVMKWTLDFISGYDCPILPVWVNLPHLPVHLFAKNALFSICQRIRNPLRMDESTINVTRPSQARICIEVDVLKPLLRRIWIVNGIKGFWQRITYENLPKFCGYCMKTGHSPGDCADGELGLDPKNTAQSSGDHFVHQKLPAEKNSVPPVIDPSK